MHSYKQNSSTNEILKREKELFFKYGHTRQIYNLPELLFCCHIYPTFHIYHSNIPAIFLPLRFLSAMGPLVGAITTEIETKTNIIRELAEQEEERSRMKRRSGARAEGGNSDTLNANMLPSSVDSISPGGYDSVRSMISTELSRDLVNFEEHTDSGCRTLLRLHRALEWLKLFMQRLGEGPEPLSGRMRKPSDLCRQAYQKTLAHHHPWWIRHMAELAFIALPERTFFYRLICVQNQEEASAILDKVVHAAEVVYNSTQRALEEHNMLDLP